jgi:hypothetical protein
MHEPISDAKEEYYEMFPHNEIQGKALKFIHESLTFFHYPNPLHLNKRMKHNRQKPGMGSSIASDQ